MVKCTCVRCHKDFMTLLPSWWCDDCKMAEFEKRQKKKPATNADRIRAMNDEDLAAWIAGMTTVCECCAELNECEAPRGFNRCSHGVEDWLKQPVEEDDHE